VSTCVSPHATDVPPWTFTRDDDDDEPYDGPVRAIGGRRPDELFEGSGPERRPDCTATPRTRSAKLANCPLENGSSACASSTTLPMRSPGVLPFEAASVTQLTAMVLLEPFRPLHEVRPDVPEAIDALVTRCLAKDPTQRPDVADVAEALDPFAPEHSRGLARRVRQVAGAPRNRSLAPPSSGEVSARIPVSGGTSVAMGRTEIAGPGATPSGNRVVDAVSGADTVAAVSGRAPGSAKSSRTALIAVALLVALGSLGGALFLSRTQEAGTSPAATAPAPAPTATPSVATASAASPEPALPATGTPTASASTAATPSSKTAAPKPVRPPVPGRPRKDRPDPAVQDDIPSDRR